jgi:hypothetical protein
VGISYAIDGPITGTTTIFADVQWEWKSADRLAFATKASVRRLADQYLETQDYSFNDQDCSLSGPIVVHTDESGYDLGFGVTAKARPSKRLTGRLGYSFHRAADADEVFQSVWNTIPRHTADLDATFEFAPGLNFWGRLRYFSATTWDDYDGIEGETCTAHLSNTTYSSTVGDALILDIQVQKWLWHDRMVTDILVRNAFNEDYRYRPDGASFDLSFYLQIKLILGPR